MGLGKLEGLSTLGFQYFLQLLLKKVGLRIDESSCEMKNAGRSMLGLYLATSKQSGEDISLQIEVFGFFNVSKFITDFQIYISNIYNSYNALNEVGLMLVVLNCHQQITLKIQFVRIQFYQNLDFF